MMNLFTYAIESSICLAVLIIFYFLLLRKDTRYKRNRVFLLLSLLVSVIIPLIHININASSPSLMNAGSFIYMLPSVDILAEKTEQGSFLTFNTIQLLYIAGLVVAFSGLLFSLGRILLTILFNSPDESRIIRLSNRKSTCFSAFGFIFISKSIPANEADRMIRHESTHVAKNHFFDLCLVAFFTVVQWFNPAIYFLRRELEAVHEYEADMECIENGEDIASYQSLIVSAALGTNIPLLTNKFSKSSLLKKRLIMMTKKKTGIISSAKMLLAIPLAILMFFIFSCNKNEEKSTATPESVNKTAVDTKTAPDQNQIFAICEQMPTFEGGDAELMNYINKTINYPEIAKQNKIQGKVIMRFCIASTGEVKYVTVARGVDPSLDEEAIRVVKSLPKFNPGKQGGKNVDVWYSLPISFQLK